MQTHRFVVEPPSFAVAGKRLTRAPVVEVRDKFCMPEHATKHKSKHMSAHMSQHVEAHVQAQVRDKFGNFVRDASDSIALALVRRYERTDGGKAEPYLQGQAYRKAMHGRATFADLSIWTTAEFMFYAWSQRLNSVFSTDIVIVHAEMRELRFIYPTSTPIMSVAGIAIFPAVHIRLYDVWGNLVTGELKKSITIQLDKETAGSAVLEGRSSAIASEGIVKFGQVYVRRAGSPYHPFTSNAKCQRRMPHACRLTCQRCMWIHMSTQISAHRHTITAPRPIA